MSDDSLIRLRDALRAFAAKRAWEPFHTPKNLAMALTGEVGELVEHFQWLTPEESAALGPEQRDAVALEMADVLLYLIRLADVSGVDLAEAAERKIAINARRYPADEVRGSARKSTR